MAAASGNDGEALHRYRPVLRYAAQERGFATGVEAMTDRGGTRLVAADGRVLASVGPRGSAGGLTAGTLGPGGSRGERLATLGRPLERGRRSEPPDTVYGHVARGSDGHRWLQYWLFYEDNPQDRGVVRIGRHASDWEFAQVRLDARGRPDRLTMAQHSWAETCAWGSVERSGGAPVLYVAHASHAIYARPGTQDRPWPDPNDEADGQGRRVRPSVRVIDERSPAWVAWPGRWGESVARPVPAESSSPRGPAFKHDRRFQDPSSFDSGARPCGSGPPGRAWQTPALVAPVAVVALMVGRRRRRRRQG